jgi:Cu2+-exporting ATPase
MFAAAAMSLSSVCVVTNALRLNLFNVFDTGKDHKIKNQKLKEISKQETLKKEGEEKHMEKIIRIDGMTCSHCEGTVKKALEAVDGVKRADVNHEAGNAIVDLTHDVADDILKKAIEDKDYEVIDITVAEE